MELVSSFVLIAARAVAGLTLTQIADYAAMRALAKTRAPASTSGPTILRLFDENNASAKPAELTSWDLGYLRSLYLTDNRLTANSQEAAISAGIRRSLDGLER
jgi:hypothetical protein